MMSSTIVQILLTVAIAKFTFYDEELAREVTAIAFAPICGSEQVVAWNVGYISRNYPDVTNIQVFTNDALGTMGFIAYNKNRKAITIIFRGSDNIENWIENLTFDKIQWNDKCNCKVHNGFKIALNSLIDKIPFNEYYVQYPNAEIHVAGHSLGAAIATLYATTLAEQGKHVFLNSMGSPRVGDAAFYAYFQTFDILHYRIVNEKDIVPHLPMHSFAFRHLDREIWYHDGAHTVCQEDKNEDKNCSYSVIITKATDHAEYVGWSYYVDC